MYNFVLINNCWYLIIEKEKESVIQIANDLAKQSLIKNRFNIEQIDMLLNENLRVQLKWLREGHILLVNESGGIHFLGKNDKIIKRITNNIFPQIEKEKHKYYTGWLSPQGRFYPCEYGKHHIFASYYNGKDKDFFIPLGHNIYDSELSYIGIINVNTITIAQKKWFNENKNHLDWRQIEILKSYFIIE